jgi:hypothetical protein
MYGGWKGSKVAKKAVLFWAQRLHRYRKEVMVTSFPWQTKQKIITVTYLLLPAPSKN